MGMEGALPLDDDRQISDARENGERYLRTRAMKGDVHPAETSREMDGNAVRSPVRWLQIY